jgi:thioesterase domain-containing protein
MARSFALETLAWMENSVVGVLRTAGIEPDAHDPARTRSEARAAGDAARHAAFIFQQIQVLRRARNPDQAAELGLTIMFVYMDAREHFGWAAPRLRGSALGGQTKQQKADKRWRKWEKHFSDVQGLGSHKAAEVIKGLGCPYSLSAIKGWLKIWSEA